VKSANATWSYSRSCDLTRVSRSIASQEVKAKLKNASLDFNGSFAVFAKSNLALYRNTRNFHDGQTLFNRINLGLKHTSSKGWPGLNVLCISSKNLIKFKISLETCIQSHILHACFQFCMRISQIFFYWNNTKHNWKAPLWDLT